MEKPRWSKIKRSRKSGFRARMRTKGGRKALSRKRRAGRSVNVTGWLAVNPYQTSVFCILTPALCAYALCTFALETRIEHQASSIQHRASNHHLPFTKPHPPPARSLPWAFEGPCSTREKNLHLKSIIQKPWFLKHSISIYAYTYILISLYKPPCYLSWACRRNLGNLQPIFSTSGS